MIFIFVSSIKNSSDFRRRNEVICEAGKQPVVVPIVVVAVDVHVPLVVPEVERSELYRVPSVPPPLEYSQGCIAFGIIMP